ncbi:MAG: hypothetical protein WCC53_05890 [Thermoanaerobaculia bacterium]
MCKVFVAGEPLWPGATRLTRINAFNIAVSSAPGTDLSAQVRDALRFIKKHARELRRLKATFPHGKPELDFAIWVKTPAETYTQSYQLPPALLKLAGDHGFAVRLSLYPT